MAHRLRILRKINAITVHLLVAASVCSVPATAQRPAAVQLSETQARLLANNCVQCHARPETGAPVMGVAEDWQKAVARGEDAMLLNVVYGIRGMPPLGYCAACTEADFRVLIRLMSGTSAVRETPP